MPFGKVPPVQKLFNGYDSYTNIPTQLRAPSLRFLSHVDHTCRNNGVKVIKNEEKLTIIYHTNTLAISVGQILVLCSTYSSSYALKPVERVIKNGQFSGFSDILTILIGKNCILLNSTQELNEIEAWLLLSFFMHLYNPLLGFVHSIFT